MCGWTRRRPSCSATWRWRRTRWCVADGVRLAGATAPTSRANGLASSRGSAGPSPRWTLRVAGRSAQVRGGAHRCRRPGERQPGSVDPEGAFPRQRPHPPGASRVFFSLSLVSRSLASLTRGVLVADLRAGVLVLCDGDTVPRAHAADGVPGAWAGGVSEDAGRVAPRAAVVPSISLDARVLRRSGTRRGRVSCTCTRSRLWWPRRTVRCGAAGRVGEQRGWTPSFIRLVARCFESLARAEASSFTKGAVGNAVTSQILVGCSTGEILVTECRGEDLAVTRRASCHLAPVAALAVHETGATVVSADDAGVLVMWDASPMDVRKRIDGDGCVFAGRGGGRRSARVRGAARSLSCRFLGGGGWVRGPFVRPGCSLFGSHARRVPATSLAVRGDMAAMGNVAGKVRLFRISAGVLLAEIDAHARAVTALDFHPCAMKVRAPRPRGAPRGRFRAGDCSQQPRVCARARDPFPPVPASPRLPLPFARPDTPPERATLSAPISSTCSAPARPAVRVRGRRRGVERLVGSGRDRRFLPGA